MVLKWNEQLMEVLYESGKNKRNEIFDVHIDKAQREQ